MTTPSTAPDAEKSPRTVMQVVKLVLKWVVYLFLFLFFVALLGFWPVEIGLLLAFGWINFILKNLVQVEMNWDLLAQGIACMAALGVGAHYFCRWLYREAGGSAGGAWRWQWTASGLAALMLLFVAGIGTIGAVHQTAWLFTGEDRLLVDALQPRVRVSEAILAGMAARTVVEEYYQGKGRLPQSGEEAGFESDGAPSSRLVASVQIREQGMVVVTLHKNRDWPEGGQITLAPTENTAAKSLTWKCRSTLPQKMLPGSCRD